MREIISPDGYNWIELDKEEIKMGFLAQCIETLAEIERCDYKEMFRRMEAVDMTEGYILKFYEPLHTQSWEAVVEDLRELLAKRERR